MAPIGASCIYPWSKTVCWITLADVSLVPFVNRPSVWLIMCIRTNEIILPDFWTMVARTMNNRPRIWTVRVSIRREIFTRTVYMNGLTALRQWITYLTSAKETILANTFITLSGINVVNYVTVTFFHNLRHSTMHYRVSLSAFEMYSWNSHDQIFHYDVTMTLWNMFL